MEYVGSGAKQGRAIYVSMAVEYFEIYCYR